MCNNNPVSQSWEPAAVDGNVDGKGESVEQMDVCLNRWTRSPPLSIHMSFGRKLYDFPPLRHGLSRWLKLSHEEEKSGINTFKCMRDVIRGLYWNSPSLIWVTICCTMTDLFREGDLVKGIGSLWFSPFSILILEVKPVFLPLERPAAHDWTPDICHFSLRGRWNPREYLPCCWDFLGLIRFFIFFVTQEMKSLSFPVQQLIMSWQAWIHWCVYDVITWHIRVTKDQSLF